MIACSRYARCMYATVTLAGLLSGCGHASDGGGVLLPISTNGPITVASYAADSNYVTRSFAEIHEGQILVATNEYFASVSGQFQRVSTSVSGMTYVYSTPDTQTMIQTCTYYDNGNTSAIVQLVHKLPNGLMVDPSFGLIVHHSARHLLNDFAYLHCYRFSLWSELRHSSGIVVTGNVVKGSAIKSLNGQYDHFQVLKNGMLEVHKDGHFTRTMTSATSYKEYDMKTGEARVVTE